MITSIFSSLKSRDYRWMWIGITAAFSAFQMQMLARGWLVYEMTSSPLALSLVTAAWGIPVVTLSFLGGAAADRLPKRTLIMLTEGLSAAISFAIAILIVTNHIALWHLLAAGLLNGIGMAFQMPARYSFIPDLVKEEELTNAFALSQLGANVMRIFAPAIAGFLLAIIGVGGVYFITASLLAFTALAMAMISNPGLSNQGSTSVVKDMAQGFDYVRKTPPFLHIILLSLAVAVLGMPYMFLLPAFARDVLKVGEVGLGWLMSATGVGAALGSLALAAMTNFPRKGLIMLTVSLLGGIGLAAFSFSTSFALALAFIGIVGTVNTGFLTLNQTLLMAYSTPEMRGRVASFNMLTFGLQPLGLLPIGALAEAWGTPIAMGGAGIALALISLVAFASPLRGLR